MIQNGYQIISKTYWSTDDYQPDKKHSGWYSKSILADIRVRYYSEIKWYSFPLVKNQTK